LRAHKQDFAFGLQVTALNAIDTAHAFGKGRMPLRAWSTTTARRKRMAPVTGCELFCHHRIEYLHAPLIAERQWPPHDGRAIEDVVSHGEFGGDRLAKRTDRSGWGQLAGGRQWETG
jgi:hypothetical protein